MKKRSMRRLAAFFACCIALVLSIAFPLFSENGGGRYALTASASSAYNPAMRVKEYDIDMTLQTDRKIIVKEKIVVEFLKSGNEFYRSLPKEGAIYSDIKATCAGNLDFSYEVAENPDYDEFIDVNCMGGVQRGKTWTYDISYIMHQNTGDTGDSMIIDVVGFGWPVALDNVTVTFHFPVAISADDFVLYVGYGSTTPDTQQVQKQLINDGKTLEMKADLPLQYLSDYDDYMAEGITLSFQLPDGTLQSYASTRLFTGNFWTVVILSIVFVGATVALFLVCHKKREIITVVNVRAPDDMDPMKMGKWLDGVVDTEDTTSMIYYFAHKGYLIINLEDEDDPVLIKQVEQLPEDEPVYAKTLFKGLFRSGYRVCASDLSEKFYKDVQKASLQLSSPKMFEPKSIGGVVGGCALGFLLGVLAPAILSAQVGGGYVCFAGGIFILPILVITALAILRECYRYKWKKSVKTGVLIAEIVVAGLTLVLMALAFGKHIMTREEVLVVCFGVFACVFLATSILTRREKYVEELGEILGFKEFIVYTEEDKIKVMLEENPQLYYKVLPYAQVLGVTDQWEEKFANILLEPPTWCVGSHMTVFDHMLMHRAMTRAMMVAMQPPQQDSTVGRSGGGGSFGGFGGGGFGGGGGGVR